MNIPIISLEVQGMKHTIKTALMREAVTEFLNRRYPVEEQQP